MATSDHSGSHNETGARTTLPGAWGFLKAPRPEDFRGKRRRQLAFDAPKKPFNYLVILDFEWTCCNRTKMVPHPEIIEFPSVLLRLHPGSTRAPSHAVVVDEFQRYVRPRHNPVLTPFCKDLTAITQEEVNSGVGLEEAMRLHTEWLAGHGITLANRHPDEPTACIVTWGDSDVLSALHTQCTAEEIPLSPIFRQGWINLKELFRRHFGREPRGGLQRCVESCGFSFDGRAHSGLVDTRNTAKIAMRMAGEGFKFVRCTRGFDQSGQPHGKKRKDGDQAPVLAAETVRVLTATK
eukprot:m.466649 g.466649  ORF g.466649 m.466649 type:complete len:294 (-) comp25434_c0_seq1:137-1018(-)